MDQQTTQTLELGTWLGRGQAFGVIANGCNAAQAECLRQIHDSEKYKLTGLSWDEFCPQFAGISRQRTDDIIKNLNEFGKTFFDLSNIVRISPEAYRKVQKRIKNDCIEIGTELVPIIPENAARIRRAVQEARRDAKRAWTENRAMKGETNVVMALLEDCFRGLEHQACHVLMTKGEFETLTGIVEYIQGKAERIQLSLDSTEVGRMREEQ
jgi:hypothetical protein